MQSATSILLIILRILHSIDLFALDYVTDKKHEITTVRPQKAGANILRLPYTTHQTFLLNRLHHTLIRDSRRYQILNKTFHVVTANSSPGHHLQHCFSEPPTHTTLSKHLLPASPSVTSKSLYFTSRTHPQITRKLHASLRSSSESSTISLPSSPFSLQSAAHKPLLPLHFVSANSHRTRSYLFESPLIHQFCPH